MAKRIDVNRLEAVVGTLYPPPYDEPCRARARTRLGDPAGLTQFGVNLLRLPPGAWSSQRHWHEGEDELVVMLEGEAVLIEDEGETVMRPGDIAVFPKGVANGHHFVNRTDKPCRLIAVGRAPAAPCYYSDIDMMVDPSRDDNLYTHKDGTPY